VSEGDHSLRDGRHPERATSTGPQSDDRRRLVIVPRVLRLGAGSRPISDPGDPLGQACRYTSCERCIHAQLNTDVLAMDTELTGMISSAASGISAAYEHVLFGNDLRNRAEIKFCKVRFLY